MALIEFKCMGENVEAWYGGAKSEIQQRWDWQEAGIPVAEPLVSDPEVGIRRVYGLLKQKKLLIVDDLQMLRDEFLRYKHKMSDDDGEPIDNVIEQKHKFHLLDAARYGLGSVHDVQPRAELTPGSRAYFEEMMSLQTARRLAKQNPW